MARRRSKADQLSFDLEAGKAAQQEPAGKPAATPRKPAKRRKPPETAMPAPVQGSAPAPAGLDVVADTPVGDPDPSPAAPAQARPEKAHTPPSPQPLPATVRPDFLATSPRPEVRPRKGFARVNTPRTAPKPPSQKSQTAPEPAPRSLPAPEPAPRSQANLLKSFDYSILQQCMHCGLCLPTCPTYDATGIERNSPRGRIALMRAIADDRLETSRAFADEMYFCLGCLACQTACPAGVNYAHLFEMARAQAEESGVLESPYRDRIRLLVLRVVFTRPWLLKLLGRALWLHRMSGLQWISRRLGLARWLPEDFRRLEPQTPMARFLHSNQRIRPVEEPEGAPARHRVGLLTGCVQDIFFPEVNRDTAEVLLVNGCAVETPRNQHCCGSLHAHNGDLETAREMARRNIDSFDLDRLDVIITNAAGCGSHLKHYDRLLEHDPIYRERAAVWSHKIRDIHEWLVETGFVRPAAPQGGNGGARRSVTYHEACHLCHGQKISNQPREVLEAIPGVELRELGEAAWCCGSAGVYNITQPEMAMQLLERKLGHVRATHADCVATANPGCLLQLQFGLRQARDTTPVRHPVTLLAEAYRAAKQSQT